jgi:4'-phosphopantetheinyl transferase EntD
MPPSVRRNRSPAWDGLFPAGVITVTAANLTSEPALLPEERPFVARAVPARVLEFATGRSCARAALAELGCPPVAIAVGQQREPVWPPGFIGSITHSQGHCAAAVACRQPGAAHGIAGLGLDAEPAQPLSEDTRGMVCLTRELEWIEQRRQDGLPWDRFVFSAKESVFKCLFPMERRWIDLHEVEVVLSDPGCFRIRAPGVRAATESVQGSYAFRDGLILTTAIWSK